MRIPAQHVVRLLVPVGVVLTEWADLGSLQVSENGNVGKKAQGKRRSGEGRRGTEERVVVRKTGAAEESGQFTESIAAAMGAGNFGWCTDSSMEAGATGVLVSVPRAR